jgi:hypothetical protein
MISGRKRALRQVKGYPTGVCDFNGFETSFTNVTGISVMAIVFLVVKRTMSREARRSS